MCLVYVSNATGVCGLEQIIGILRFVSERRTWDHRLVIGLSPHHCRVVGAFRFTGSTLQIHNHTFMDKTQTTPPVALEEPGWGLDATLSDSSTPPRQIAPRRAGVAP